MLLLASLFLASSLPLFQSPAPETEQTDLPWWQETVEPVPHRVATPTAVDIPAIWWRENMPEGVPAPVLERILHHREKALERVKDSWQEPEVRESLRSKLSHVDGPRGTRLWLHDLSMPTWPGTWAIFLEDTKTGKVADDAIHIKPTHSLRLEPTFCDLDGDGVEELVTKSFYHNGTVLNYYPQSWWSIGEDLRFRRVLSLRSHDYGIWVDKIWGSARRELSRGPGGQLQVVIQRDNIKRGYPSVLLGRVLLKQEESGSWKPVEDICWEPEAPWAKQATMKETMAEEDDAGSFTLTSPLHDADSMRSAVPAEAGTNPGHPNQGKPKPAPKTK